MNNIISGKALVCGDYITAYDIIPEKHWYIGAINEESMGPWAFEEMIEGFENKAYALRDAGYTIVVGGLGFGGGGKSIEHPIYALKGAGVQAVLADSFARYNFRNSINKGLPAFQCEEVSKFAESGDNLVIDAGKGTVTNERTGQTLQFEPLPTFVKDILDAGGLLEYTKSKLDESSPA